MSLVTHSLEKCGIVEFMEHYNGGGISPETFDKLHENWCEAILKSWEEDQVANVCTFLGLDRNFHENQTWINRA